MDSSTNSSINKSSFSHVLSRSITSIIPDKSKGESNDQLIQQFINLISNLEQLQLSFAPPNELLECVAISLKIRQYPRGFFNETQIFTRINALLEKCTIDTNTYFKFVQLLSIISTNCEESMNSFLTNCKFMSLLHHGFTSTNPNIYNIYCQFIIKSLPYSSARNSLISANFFVEFMNRMKYLLNLVSEGNLSKEIIQLIAISCDLFFHMVKHFSISDLEPGKSEIQDMIIALYDCHVSHEILDKIAHIVLIIGSKFSYMDIVNTEMWNRTIKLLDDDNNVLGYQYSLALLNNTVCSDDFMEITEIIPFQDIVRIINSRCFENIDIQINAFHCLLSFSVFGDTIISHFLDSSVFNSILNIINLSNFAVKQLGCEILWAFIKCGTFEQAEYIIEHPISKEIILNAISEDTPEDSHRIITVMIIPFVNSLISHNLQGESTYASFLSDLAQVNSEILDSGEDELSEAAQLLQSILDSIE
ncbi:hypothetical protein TVAG_469050 [Trichomonas vaginalis G3]|uniref:Uncharacterized protein n=1 Tax=Trichomonas vaginalis (strain ATCC PRA-98 / G3) TaxID=412133 RepID=A2FD76_TRIV3|nr:armadillo (ARM) repeat-containing protein family [Trichomonas vaginalis G3]EAX97132.1 hypothetical protein TVAG_469050 [Trichomonas vaginalis G3]KAI5549243.1 armadillo (ARM) repeat-containing protein family [Trichomonas vaginalis G3]|eukprot:XP_001310062.1 hypothetical protein [Trichomonas vaginalis G3]